MKTVVKQTQQTEKYSLHLFHSRTKHWSFFANSSPYTPPTATNLWYRISLWPGTAFFYYPSKEDKKCNAILTIDRHTSRLHLAVSFSRWFRNGGGVKGCGIAVSNNFSKPHFGNVLSWTVATRYSPAKAVEYIFSVLAGDRECKNLSLKFFRPFSGSGRTSVTASLSSFHHLSYT